ncbi:hypothetical protein MKP08_09035 [Erythrobacter sp. LQ02-29]|uniref:hypothetical protein n=1 Tax=Erythrobacter sp. LQ02-29 TaxID=2920384 RepID=UPI001F4DB872|nr:hypothetical protein [Erythrobacter sp. LQ02-29]MCP9222889.1 hypothetical protein [Erythrobacter sp. LQ02-29]
MAIRPRYRVLPFLAFPVLAGIVWMAGNGAPRQYIAVNAVALAISLAAALWLRPPHGAMMRRGLFAFLLLLLFLPLASGPHLDGISRWLPLGPVTLHAGGLALPALLVLMTRERLLLLVGAPLALLAAILQPDAALALSLALGVGAIGMVGRETSLALFGVAGIVAAVVLRLSDTLEPQMFVEHVFATAAAQSLVWVLVLAAAAIVGLVALLTAPVEKLPRLALAASFGGLVLASLIGPYPTALIGYGAAPILGYGLALGLLGQTRSAPSARPFTRSRS